MKSLLIKSGLPLMVCIFLASQLKGQVNMLTQNFATCPSTFPSDWTRYSVTGTEGWDCNSYGKKGACITMSGYFSGNNYANQDWLISPKLEVADYSLPILQAWMKTNYTGNSLQVLVSTNYPGIGNPNSYTWTNVTATLPAINSDVWTLVQSIQLSAFKGSPFYLAFKYTSTNTSASTWSIDEINLSDAAFHCNEVFMNLGQTSVGIPSATKSFQFTIDSVKSPFKVIAPAPFEVSKDGVNFSTQLTYDSTIKGILQQVFIRILPQQTDKVYHKEIEFMQNNLLLPNKIKLLGTSLPDPSTLRLATWNMRWFGDPTNCNCDTAIAKSNALKLMQTLDADIYCLQEVVSNSQIKDLAISLGPQFAYAVSTFGSFAQDTSDNDYASAQKLAYIYNKNKVQNLGSFGLLASTYPSYSGTGSPYNCFSSGRFPFVMKLKLNLPNSQTDTLILANIHGKASSTYSDYIRRECGARYMTDSLNALFPNKKVAVLGDYNDLLVGSGVSGQTISPYDYLLNNNFIGVTLPSLFVGQTSYLFSENYLIDNICLSNSLKSNYPDSSTFIFHDAQDIIDEYAYTTSDHLPIMTYFKLSYPLGIHSNYESSIRYDMVNPSSGILQVNDLHKEDVEVLICDIQGKKVFQHKYKSNSPIQENLSYLKTGLYIIRFKDSYGEQSKKWLIQ